MAAVSHEVVRLYRMPTTSRACWRRGCCILQRCTDGHDLELPTNAERYNRMLVECLADAHGLQHRTLGKGGPAVTIWKNTEEATKPSQRRKRGRDPMPSKLLVAKMS